LWESLTNMRAKLSEARATCKRSEEGKNQQTEDVSNTNVQRMQAERERLRHVQVDGTLGCAGRSSRVNDHPPVAHFR